MKAITLFLLATGASAGLIKRSDGYGYDADTSVVPGSATDAIAALKPSVLPDICVAQTVTVTATPVKYLKTVTVTKPGKTITKTVAYRTKTLIETVSVVAATVTKTAATDYHSYADQPVRHYDAPESVGEYTGPSVVAVAAEDHAYSPSPYKGAQQEAETGPYSSVYNFAPQEAATTRAAKPSFTPCHKCEAVAITKAHQTVTSTVYTTKTTTFIAPTAGVYKPPKCKSCDEVTLTKKTTLTYVVPCPTKYVFDYDDYSCETCKTPVSWHMNEV
ncbi:hypothetical protein EDC01DRAFT_169021 [Geopyxis carbonaria]|nr:hypothetical protein EDC01DRAFT_169021 [Geopyxis carbonaria]